MTCPQCGTLNPNENQECVRCRRRLRAADMIGKIPCESHAAREATTSCGSCGKRLCEICARNASGVDFCDACAPESAVGHTVEEGYQRVPLIDVGHAEYAPLLPRLLAGVVDVAILLAVACILALLFWLLSGSLNFLVAGIGWSPARVLYLLLTIGIVPVYFVILTAMTGQTLGKQFAGVIVLQEDGRVLSLRMALRRYIFGLVSLALLGLGYLWAAWDPEHKTWHDKLSHTAAFRWTDWSEGMSA